MKLLIDNFESELASLAMEAKRIKVMIAFLTKGGIEWIPNKLIRKSEFLVGTDLRITRPEALKWLQDNGSSLRVFEESGRMFHPKAIYLNCGAEEFLIVGSNNLTCSGISSNHEIAMIISKDESTKDTFDQFHEHFEFLKNHDCSFVPDQKFYDEYKPSSIRSDLQFQINNPDHNPMEIDLERAASFGLFLKKIAHDFPNLERKTGLKIKNHPLSVFNKETFTPLFRDIIEGVSSNLSAQSSLRQGGKWLNMPNIYARDNSQEDWEDFDGDGAVSLQIHFDKKYTEMHFSVVISYNIRGMGSKHKMPIPVETRYLKIRDHLEGFGKKTRFDLPEFFNWTNNEDKRWDKPIISLSYEVANLPDDRKLIADLRLLGSALNSAMAIR